MLHLHHLANSRSFRIIWLLEELKVDYIKIGSGVVEYSVGIPSVTFNKEHELCYLSLDDKNHDFKVIGNRLENKALL